MVNTRSNPQTARGRRRRLREKPGTTSKATSKYHSGTYSTDPGTAHSHIRTIRAPSIASSSRDVYQENTPPASTRSRGAAFVVKPVVQVLNGGKPTFASKLRESVEREAKARRRVEAGRPDFDWEDKVSEDEEEEGGVNAGEVEVEDEEKEEEVVEPMVQTAMPKPTSVRAVPATQTVRKVFVATPFEPPPISRVSMQKEVISELEPPKPYDGPFKHIAANNAARVDKGQSMAADVQDKQEIFEDTTKQSRHQESLLSDSVEDVDNRRGSLHLADEPSQYEYGASFATLGSFTGNPSLYTDHDYYRSMSERRGFAGHSSTAATGYGTPFSGRFAAASDGSFLGDLTERSVQGREMSDEEKKEMKEVNDRLYRINHRSDLAHRLETLHLASKSPGLNVMFDQQTREEAFNHWGNCGKPLPTLDGTGGWGPHTTKDVTDAGLGDVFDLSITKSPAVTSPFIEGSIRNPAYARKLREVYSGSKSIPKLHPGVQSSSSLGPLDQVLDDVASRLSYLHNEQNLHAFAEDEPELEYGRCVEYASPAESFMSAEDLDDSNGAYDYFNEDSPCLRMSGHVGPGTRDLWRKLRTQWREVRTPPKMKPLVSPSLEPHFSPAPISPGMPGFTFRFPKPARQPKASGIVNIPVFHLMEPGYRVDEWSDSDLNDALDHDPFGARTKRRERDGRMAPTPSKGRRYGVDLPMSPDGGESAVSAGQMFVEGQ